MSDRPDKARRQKLTEPEFVLSLVREDARQSVQQDVQTDEVNRPGVVGQRHKGETAEFLTPRRDSHSVHQLDDLVGSWAKGINGEVGVGADVEHVRIHADPHLARTTGYSPGQFIGPPLVALAPRLFEFPRGVDVLPFDAALREPHKRLAIVDRPAQSHMIISGRIHPGKTKDPARPRRPPPRLARVVLLPLASLVVMMRVKVEHGGRSIGPLRHRLQYGVRARPRVPPDSNRNASRVNDLLNLLL